LDLLGGELGGCAARLAWDQCLQPAASVATDPLVDEPRRAAQTPGGLVTFELVFGHEQHCAVAVALQSLTLGGNQLAELIQILRMMQCELHPHSMPSPPRQRESAARRSQVWSV